MDRLPELRSSEALPPYGNGEREGTFEALVAANELAASHGLSDDALFLDFHSDTEETLLEVMMMPTFSFSPYDAGYMLQGYDGETFFQYLKRIGVPRAERLLLIERETGLRLVPDSAPSGG